MLHEIRGELVNDADFAAAPIAQRNRILQKLMVQADKAAAKQFAEQIPEADLEQRILDHQAKRAPQPISPATGQRLPVPSTPTPLSLTPVAQPTAAAQPLGSPLSLTPGNQPTSPYPFGQPTKTQGVLHADGTPDDNVTPGAVVPGLTADKLHAYGLSQRAVTAQTRQAVFDAYGIPGDQRSQMVIDHRVPRGLGGAYDQANLAPQPKDVAKQKDVVEIFLMGQVAAGKMPVDQAQRTAAYDWQNQYQQIPPAERQRIQQHLASLGQQDRAVLIDQ
jgi:hypothetical protein